jgi:hypothetical protein
MGIRQIGTRSEGKKKREGRNERKEERKRRKLVGDG